MSYRLAVSCDGHRHGMSCRGAYFSRDVFLPTAHVHALSKGWRTVESGHHIVLLCPSGGHDEEAS